MCAAALQLRDRFSVCLHVCLSHRLGRSPFETPEAEMAAVAPTRSDQECTTGRFQVYLLLRVRITEASYKICTEQAIVQMHST